MPFVTQGQAIHAADHLLRGSHCLGNAIATFFTHPCISTEKQGVSTHFEHPESETGKLKEKKKNAAFENQESQWRRKFCSLQILEIPKDSEILQEDVSACHEISARSNLDHR